MILGIPKYSVVDQIHRVFTLHSVVRMVISDYTRRTTTTLLTNYKGIMTKTVL